MSLIPIIRQSNPHASNMELLELAYDRAAWANPNTRQQRMDAQAKTQEQKRSEAAKKAADDAMRAKSINVTGSPSSVDPDVYDSDMRRIFRKNHAA